MPTASTRKPKPSATVLAKERIRVQLDRICGSDGLKSSPILIRLLRYCVEHALANDLDRMKESLIGVEVFDRPASYDPANDSVVRGAARRLRSKLDEYYQNTGAADPLIIDLPKGGYVPAFRERDTAAATLPAPRGPSAQHDLRPIALAIVFAAVLAATVFILLRARSDNPGLPGKSIAVLPFLNLAGDKDGEYLSDALTEELTNELSRISRLRVVARTSAWYFKGKVEDVRAIGQKLNVSTVMEGSLQRNGERLRVNVRVIDTATGFEIWSDAFETLMNQFPDLRLRIAQAAARSLKLAYAPSAAPTLENSEAHDLWARGRYLERLQIPLERVHEAIGLYERAVKADPKFALGYASIADTYARMGANDQMDPATALSKARRAAEEALQLDDKLAEAHAALGLVRWTEWDLRGAEQEQRRALAINPNFALAWHRLALVHLAQARFAEAEREIKMARALNPMTFQAIEALGEVYHYWRQDGKAREQCDFLIHGGQAPDELPLLAAVDEGAGHYQAALELLSQIARRHPDWPDISSHEGRVLARLGKYKQAQGLIQEVIAQRSPAHYASAFDIASVFAAMNDKDTAFQWLQTAFREHDPHLISLKVDPWTDALRADPRYQDLLKRIGLE